MRWYLSARTRLGLSLLITSACSTALYFVGAHNTHSTAFGYLLWNLFLAWIPFVLTLWVARLLRRKLWSSWLTLIVTVLWLGFLPNTFYLVSDLVHLHDMPHADPLYDVVMFASFALNGMVLGYLSVFMMHLELLKRVGRRLAGTLIALVLLLCSFAIYLGHDLRWNTWDVLINPAGLLVDVSDPVLHPRANGAAFTTTLLFLVLIGSFYLVVWQLARLMRQQKV